MSQYLFLLLILAACPLMMIFMMRGMHGGHGGNAESGHTHSMTDGSVHGPAGAGNSLDDLRRQRDELDRQIDEREADEQAPVGSGWR
jgi:hypothetical protein